MNKDRTWQYRLGSLTVAIGLGVSACSLLDTPDLTPIPTAAVTIQITPSQTVAPSTPTETPFPIASLTPTQKPLTSTAQTVLSAEEAKSLMLDLLQSNGNCRLPCLWGVTPGEAGTQTLEAFMAQLGNAITTNEDTVLHVDRFANTGGVDLSYYEDDSDFRISFSYYMAGDRVSQLALSTDATKIWPEEGQVFGDSDFNQLLQYYALPHVLSEYGRPAQVLIAPFPDDPDYPSPEWIPFSVVLYYPDKGILVEYLSPRETKGDQYVGCPHKAHVYATVWNPQHKPALSEIVTKLSGQGINELNVDYFKSVEDATTTDLDSFFEEFKDARADSACLETSVSIWP
ncbi:MAG TPA: hypothetical protein VJ123_08995 [Anaerolineales bacterium]|nr:hypothetical protein [Anaerolineales bacterium]